MFHAVVTDIGVAQPELLEAEHFADRHERLIVEPVAGEVQLAQRRQAVSCARPWPSTREPAMPNDSEMLQARQFGEAGVGDRGLVQIELLQPGEALDRIETLVADLRDLQVQFFQAGQTGQDTRAAHR